jgi:hypothetical protein
MRDGRLDVPAGHFAIGQPGDVAVLGRWACTTTSLVALLKSKDSSVWVFDSWPAPTAGAEVRGRLVGTVDGATSLRVIPGSDGCDRLDVVRAHGAPVHIEPGA